MVCHSGLDPESSVFLDSSFRGNDGFCYNEYHGVSLQRDSSNVLQLFLKTLGKLLVKFVFLSPDLRKIIRSQKLNLIAKAFDHGKR
jgi:hypothetical protein